MNTSYRVDSTCEIWILMIAGGEEFFNGLAVDI